MLKIIFSAIFLVAVTFSNFVEAADKPKVAVMDLGEFRGAYTSELNTQKVGAMVSDYIIKALTDDGRFTVISKRFFKEQIDAKNLQKAGIISPNQAKEIAKILGVDYLIYGHVSSVDGDDGVFEVIPYGGGKLYELKAQLHIRITAVKNGGRRIIAMAKGEGVSKSSEVKVGKDTIFLKIGVTKIPQVSVHNALKKAAFDATDKLLVKIFES